MTGKEGRRIEVKDVLVGEVWLGSGQSNMAMTVAGCYHFDAEKAAAKDPLIRHYRESSGPSDTPQAEGKGQRFHRGAVAPRSLRLPSDTAPFSPPPPLPSCPLCPLDHPWRHLGPACGVDDLR